MHAHAVTSARSQKLGREGLGALLPWQQNSHLYRCVLLQVQDETFARVRVLFETGTNQGYQFKTHPNIDKQLYASNVLGLKDAERPFPTGTALPILKWRMQARNPVALRMFLPAATLYATTCAPPLHTGFSSAERA